MVIKYNAHFLHNDDVQCLDNLPYLEKFVRIIFDQDRLRRLLSPSVCKLQTP